MATTSRRHFLKASATVAAGISLNASPVMGKTEEEPSSESIPDHQSVSFPGLHAYAQKSIAAGEDIVFRASSSVPYRLRVLRLAGEVDNPAGDIEIGKFSNPSPSVQPVHLGSYVHVPHSLADEDLKHGFTIECWVRPWGFNRDQGIVTQLDHNNEGFGLLLRPDSRVELVWSDPLDQDKKRLATTAHIRQ